MKLFKIVIFLIALQTNWAQNSANKIDSIYNADYDELSEKFRLLSKDSTRYREFASAYLSKSKAEKDIIKQSNGYFLQALISKEFVAIKYADSIIELTQNIKDFNYPAKAYILKARNLGRKEMYSQALDELIKANHFAIKNNNINQEHEVDYFIALLKQSIGEYEESLAKFKKTAEFYASEYNKNNKNKYKYLKTICALSSSYNYTKKYDSAFSVIEKSIPLSLKSQDSIFYGYLLLSSGITQYYKKNYNSGLDSILKFKSIYQDRIKDGNISISNLYLGKIYHEINDVENSLFFLEKVDSITPSKLRDCYELLLKINKKKGNIKKQIEYIDKILKIDSVISKESRYLYKNIAREYSTPNLILEKEKIISSFKRTEKRNNIWIFSLIASVILLTTILFINNFKKRIYKKRFIELYNSISLEESKRKLEENFQEKSDIGIPKKIINEVLIHLDSFEQNKEFTSSGLTVTELAKTFETNSRYLSKIINHYKGKSFSNYINDLRIDYVIEELKQNNKFRKYTIKAISYDIGFKSTQVFSKLFYKKTGIYPSFFLKQLEKENKQENY